MGRFVPIVVTNNPVLEKTSAFKVTGGKGYYDGKQCWPYKVVYDRPGTYSFTVPAGIVCARTVVIGGGGKPKCITIGSCCSSAGAGGGLSEKYFTVTPGAVIGITVGRQEGTSSITCNSVAIHSATGATGCNRGTGSGGDWNSTGGYGGWGCNYCGGSVSHWCGSCKYLCVTTCCGYCIVYTCMDSQAGATDCCNMILNGGGSAGSPVNLCGGSASCICGYLHAGVAAGGAGIGGQAQSYWHYNCCNCNCIFNNNGHSDHDHPRTPHPTSAQGGGGTQYNASACCRSWQGQCINGIWQGGKGGPGGTCNNENEAWTFEWGWSAYCGWPFGVRCCSQWKVRCGQIDPAREPWWDIQDIKGSGSPGHVAEWHQRFSCMGTSWGNRPANAGEGSGTGGLIHYCCNPMQQGWGMGTVNNNGGPLVNWTKICQLGLCGQTDQAYKMVDALFPFFITCAGILGGSGGVGICGHTSKAGYGGGGGEAKCQLLCVCYGGSFDCCNGAAATPLAFSPCILDNLISNAGSGYALLYYRDY